RRPRGLLLHAGFEAAALDHETVDHAMEDGVVVEPVAGVLQEIPYGLGRFFILEVDHEIPHAGLHPDPAHWPSTILASSMTICSRGTSVGNGPPLPVGILTIWSTTSMPLTTLPNTA